MKIRERMKDKKEFVGILILTIFALGLILIVSQQKGNELFGSTTDWLCQHVAYVESFRSNFYDTKDWFPDFLMGVGGGQNSYNYSYYGLFRPDVILACLFPGVTAKNVVTAYMIGLYIVGMWILYGWLRRRGTSKTLTFLLSGLYLTSSVLFQSHRQIMFVNYMPFLILALRGIDRLLERKKYLTLIMGVFLMIMHSYYFSITGLFVCLIYYMEESDFLVRMWKKEERKGLIGETVSFGVSCMTGVGMSGILLLPTAIAMLQNSRTSANEAMESLWIPDLSLTSLLYSPYGCGFTAIVLIFLLLGVFFRRTRRLSLATLVCFTIPFVAYVLNGMLYVRTKIFMCFIPLVLFIIGMVWEELEKQYVHHCKRAMRGWMVKLLFVGMIALQAGNCLKENEIELYVTQEQYENIYEKEKFPELTGEYRVSDLSTPMNTANLVNTPNMRKTSVYSSVSNAYYDAFWKEVMQNPQSVRNSLCLTECENIFFQTLMGVKYVYQEDGTLRTQEKVLPLGYVSYDCMAEEMFEQVDYPYTLDTIVNRTIVEGSGEKESLLSGTSSYDSQLSEEEISFRQLQSGVSEASMDTFSSIGEVKEDTLKVYAKEDVTVKANLSNPGDITILSFQVQSHWKDDVFVTINGVKEKLSGKTAAYKNYNHLFSYVLLDAGEGLNITFSKGAYTLSDMKMYTCNSSAVTARVDTISPLQMEETHGKEVLKGTVTATAEGYFVTSIPYQEGMQATVDGEEVTVEKVNTAFCGFQIEEGEHEVILTFHAPGKTAGAALSVLGVLVFLGIGLWEKYNRK